MGDYPCGEWHYGAFPAGIVVSRLPFRDCVATFAKSVLRLYENHRRLQSQISALGAKPHCRTCSGANPITEFQEPSLFISWGDEQVETHSLIAVGSTSSWPK